MASKGGDVAVKQHLIFQSLVVAFKAENLPS